MPLPSEVGGFILAILLTMTAMASLGLLIASLARSQRVAGAIGGILFFPLMFFAGLWVPQQRWADAAHDQPVHAARRRRPVDPERDFGHWPGTTHLLVLVAWAVVVGALATRLFRWE